MSLWAGPPVQGPGDRPDPRDRQRPRPPRGQVRRAGDELTPRLVELGGSVSRNLGTDAAAIRAGGRRLSDYGTVPGTYNNIWLGLVFFNPAKLRVVVYFRLLEPPPRLVQDISASACLWLAGSTPYLRAAVALVDGRAGGFVSAMHAASERRHRRIVARRFRLSGSRFWWTRRRAHIAWKSLRLYPQFPQSGFLAGFPNPCFSTDPAVPNTCSELLVLIT